MDLMAFLRETLKVPYTVLCDVGKLAYSTFMRWRGRAKRDEPLVTRPGPKPVEPLDLGALEGAVGALPHRNKRTHGTGALYNQVKGQVSRRDFQELVRQARSDAKAERAVWARRIHWTVPHVVWSMDDTLFGRDCAGQKLFLHTVSDLGSRYRFPPPGEDFACGEEVAGNLEYLFGTYGCPLFMKRDNHGTLNHSAVEEVLSRHGVIPLNSPTYYPPYNGAAEKAQYEVKSLIARKLEERLPCPREQFLPVAREAYMDWNHTPRRSLQGDCACFFFFAGKKEVSFSKRERKSIFDWIVDQTNAIIEFLGDNSKRAAQAARRIAVENWLSMKGFIEVSVGANVLPSFSGEIYH